MAELVSVNVGLPRTIDTPRGPVTTAIFKSPTQRRLRAAPHNLEGDRQADLSVHGGENKAVYAYPIEHYAFWAEELGRVDLEHGQFGENLTTRGLLEHEVGVGDVFSIGSNGNRRCSQLWQRKRLSNRQFVQLDFRAHPKIRFGSMTMRLRSCLVLYRMAMSIGCSPNSSFNI